MAKYNIYYRKETYHMLFCRQKSSIIFNLFDNQPCKPLWRLAGSIVPVLHRSVWRSQQLCHPLYCQASGFTCRLYLVFFHADHLHMIYPPYTSPDMKNSAHLLLTSSNVKKKRSTNNRSMAKSPGYIFFIVKPPQILYNWMLCYNKKAAHEQELASRQN